MNTIAFSGCRWCGLPLAWMPDLTRQVPVMAIDEDSLSTQEMADIEDGKPVLFDGARHKRHVCHEVEDVAGETERKRI